MKKMIVLAIFWTSSLHAMENEELKQKPPRVIFDSPRNVDGAMRCIDEGSEVWRRYFNARDHRTYRKAGSVDIEYLSAPATIFAIQNRIVLISINSNSRGGTHLQFWGVPAVDALDPADAASRGHAAVHANKSSRLQQSIDSMKICLATPDAETAVSNAAVIKVGVADELAKRADLRAKGIINDTEFQTQKARLLAAP